MFEAVHVVPFILVPVFEETFARAVLKATGPLTNIYSGLTVQGSNA